MLDDDRLDGKPTPLTLLGLTHELFSVVAVAGEVLAELFCFSLSAEGLRSLFFGLGISPDDVVP